MAKFKLELDLGNDNWMLLTDYDSSSSIESTSIVFEEELNEEINDSYTLNFKCPNTLDGIPVGKLFVIGRVIKLTFSNPQRVVLFVISSYSLEDGKDNFIYNVEARDYVSYTWSKNNAGLNLDTIDDQDFLDWMDKVADSEDTTITNIGNYILERGWLRKRTKPNTAWVFEGWEVECNDKTYDNGTKKFRYNISLSNSNTYNALVELANISSTIIRVDYINKKIKFIHQDETDAETLEKNYTLKKGFNIQDLGLNFNGDEIYGMFFIQGGTDIDGNYVILSDETVYKDNFIYDFGYYLDAELLTSAELSEIDNLITADDLSGQIVPRSLKKINTDFQDIIEKKYISEGILSDFRTRIKINAEACFAEGQSGDDFISKYNELQSIFYYGINSNPEPVYSDTRKNMSNFDWVNILQFSSDALAEANFPAVIGGKRYRTDLEYTINFITDPENPILKSTNVKFFNETGANRIKISNIGNVNVQMYFQRISGDNIPNDFFNDKITRSFISFKPFSVKYTLTKFFPFFQELINYDGIDYLNLEWKKLNDDIISLKDEIISSNEKLILVLDELELTPSGDRKKELEVEKAGLESIIANGVFGVGSFTRINSANYTWSITELGYFTQIRKIFWETASQFSGDGFLNGDNTRIFSFTPSIFDNIEPILNVYRRLLNEKNNFWYSLKKKFGTHIFTEGYYEDNIETNTLNLKQQAELIYLDHKRPNQEISVSYIDVSDLIGINLEDIRVGDKIKIDDEKIDIEKNGISKIKVMSISRKLRSDADISLSVSKYNSLNTLVEKIVAMGNKNGK